MEFLHVVILHLNVGSIMYVWMYYVIALCLYCFYSFFSFLVMFYSYYNDVWLSHLNKDYLLNWYCVSSVILKIIYGCLF